MSISSMTGFGRATLQNEHFSVVVEIKSVNHRFVDFKIKQPSYLSGLDLQYRKMIKDKLTRGSFDVVIHVKKNTELSKADEINWDKVNCYIETLEKKIGNTAKKISINATEFMRNEFYFDHDYEPNLELEELVLKTLEEALDKLDKARKDEGQKLHSILVEHRQSYEKYFSIIKENEKEFEQIIKDKILLKCAEYSPAIEIEKPRFMQEVIYYLEKMDIHEEMNRIISHLKRVDKVLAKREPIGREIEFVLQELNRETNTIGSKSSIIQISDHVVNMKVQLEKMREQSLNIE